jgi:hypothetical protein
MASVCAVPRFGISRVSQRYQREETGISVRLAKVWDLQG